MSCLISTINKFPPNFSNQLFSSLLDPILSLTLPVRVLACFIHWRFTSMCFLPYCRGYTVTLSEVRHNWWDRTQSSGSRKTEDEKSLVWKSFKHLIQFKWSKENVSDALTTEWNKMEMKLTPTLVDFWRFESKMFHLSERNSSKSDFTNV